MDRGVGVVAVATAHRVPVTVGVEALVDRPIAVVVDEVTLLAGLRMHRLVRVVAIAVAGGEAITIDIEALVHSPVAVVVRAIAELPGFGVDVRVAVGAVARAAGEAITIDVEALVHSPVTVVVRAIADFGGERVDRRVAVIAVTGAGLHPVPVDVEALVDGAVAVVVHGVTDLDRARIHRRIPVVAVAVAQRVTVQIHVGTVASSRPREPDRGLPGAPLRLLRARIVGEQRRGPAHIETAVACRRFGKLTCNRRLPTAGLRLWGARRQEEEKTNGILAARLQSTSRSETLERFLRLIRGGKTNNHVSL